MSIKNPCLTRGSGNADRSFAYTATFGVDRLSRGDSHCVRSSLDRPNPESTGDFHSVLAGAGTSFKTPDGNPEPEIQVPELPEVETVRRGIEPHLTSCRITAVRIRERRLRWPVSRRIAAELPGLRIEGVSRRAKYLLLSLSRGHLLIHLGMSGSLRILPAPHPAQKHDHLDIELETGACLRFRDPRRFGCVLFTTRPPERHRLLRALGPEPLSDAFSGGYLYQRSRGRRVCVKSFLMDSRIVVGIGNIYANEALHLAGIHPARPAGRIKIGRAHV